MTWGETLRIATLVAVAFLSLGIMIGEDRGVRVVECQQAGYGAPPVALRGLYGVAGGEQMKRDITFHNDGDLTTALGVSETRSLAIELRINEMIERNASKREVLTHFNEEWDLSDAEWTSMVFGLGFYEGSFVRRGVIQ